ncbi:MAG: flagellar hook-associated protein FlgL, partial [bacterium]|nr:flagellar hook-associated protein FlgL [bacterium]
MRVTPNTMRYEALYRINWQLENMRDLTDQISSGKALRRPSDNPVDMAMAMRYRSRLADYNTFDENIYQTRTFLQEVDMQLGKMNDLVRKARDIAVQGANGTYEEHSREAIGFEVEQIYEELVRTANSSIDGRYIFSGNKTSTVPFTVGYDGNDEVILYKGDNGIRSLEVGENAYVEENIPGSELFYPPVTRSTTLGNLRNGLGIEAGTIRITDGSGAATTINIITNPLDPNVTETVGDVIDLINNDGVVDVYAELNKEGTGLILTDQSGATASPFKIEDTAGSSAAQLGILRESMSGQIVGKPMDNKESIFIVIRRLRDALFN